MTPLPPEGCRAVLSCFLHCEAVLLNFMLYFMYCLLLLSWIAQDWSWKAERVWLLRAGVWFLPQKRTPETQGHHGCKCLWSYKTFQCSEPVCVSLSLGLSSTKDESMFILKFSRMQMSSTAFSQFSKFIYTMKLNCTDLSKFIRNWFNFPLQGSYAPSCELIKSAPWTISVLANQLLYFQSLLKSVTYFKSW